MCINNSKNKTINTSQQIQTIKTIQERSLRPISGRNKAVNIADAFFLFDEKKSKYIRVFLNDID